MLFNKITILKSGKTGNRGGLANFPVQEIFTYVTFLPLLHTKRHYFDLYIYPFLNFEFRHFFGLSLKLVRYLMTIIIAINNSLAARRVSQIRITRSELNLKF